MYFTKYTETLNKKLIVALYILLFVWTIVCVFSMFLFGLVYLYQSFISMLYSFTFLVFCLNYDNEILIYCEKVGFIIRLARKYQFYLLFLCIGMFMAMIMLIGTVGNNWQEQYTWIINASRNE